VGVAAFTLLISHVSDRKVHPPEGESKGRHITGDKILKEFSYVPVLLSILAASFLHFAT